MSEGLYSMEAKDFDKTLDLTKIKPYGDTMNDGKVQLSFTLPVPCGAEAVEAAKEHGVAPHVGNILSSDPFYTPEGHGKNDEWKRMGVMAVEMEAAGLYANAAYAHKRALCICTISDHIYRPEDNLSAEERQIGFTQMMEIALDTAVKMAQL